MLLTLRLLPPCCSLTFENHIKDKGRWHRELLEKMLLDVPPLRPRVSLRAFAEALTNAAVSGGEDSDD